ncbi:cytochrome c biogenesis CcdA family protein [Geobacter sp. SVR]|uniref:cytochrome c biogenesis CcdA family protein n=1 Tax=Geobacter sp. SVR TaxID=2495594 RepID=UPI00143F053E|nr:cytochrome c biogenesis protein CcdA [Geobacter sp. SVR]BCS53959.1 cytochrome C biogenesis protein CcdA [Geobacter sp. SVR]GCF86260.1 cytochrome C biogenesis protein CcdA [Geobacter sp. SVR]
MPSQQVTYLGAILAGLLSFLSPCVLPLIPSFITYITGLSFSDLQAEHPSNLVRRKTIFHSLCFIAGFTVVFVFLGASATLIGTFLQEHVVAIRRVGGLLIFFFGLHVTGLIPIGALLGEKRVSIKHKPAGYAGSFLVGLVFAAGWTPCIGPILASILMVAATEGNMREGITLLLLYSLGLGLPFLISSLALHQFLVVFNRFKKFIRVFEIITGLFLMGVGILLFFNWLSRLSAYSNMLFNQ